MAARASGGLNIGELASGTRLAPPTRPWAIQELVGHSTLTMTLRYMHLAPSALRQAIGLLALGQQMGDADVPSTASE
jgi:hypothetical protein